MEMMMSTTDGDEKKWGEGEGEKERKEEDFVKQFIRFVK